jgi:hypothetical protein
MRLSIPRPTVHHFVLTVANFVFLPKLIFVFLLVAKTRKITESHVSRSRK